MRTSPASAEASQMGNCCNALTKLCWSPEPPVCWMKPSFSHAGCCTSIRRHDSPLWKNASSRSACRLLLLVNFVFAHPVVIVFCLPAAFFFSFSFGGSALIVVGAKSLAKKRVVAWIRKDVALSKLETQVAEPWRKHLGP